jgi:hypothetical protein
MEHFCLVSQMDRHVKPLLYATSSDYVFAFPPVLSSYVSQKCEI